MATRAGSDQYPGLGSLVAERRYLLSLGYLMLSSAQDAEDVVQETYTRWYTSSEQGRLGIDAPMVWLSRVASRICLDRLTSARARRGRYTGEWLPEPVRERSPEAGTGAGSGGDPADRITPDDLIGVRMLGVLDSITPAERVVFILRDVFGMPFTEIAETVGRAPAVCRQLASSARRSITAGTR